MAKNPAVLFYTSDFLSGTTLFTDEQLGQYIKLLCHQHQNGHLPEQHMLNICKSYDNPVMSKFTKDTSGFYYNERMDEEINKRTNYCNSRRLNRSNDSKEEKDMSSHMSSHMDNDNDNDNRYKKIDKKVKEKKVGIDIPTHLLEIWPDFIEMRKRLKAPLTDRAIKNILSILSEHPPEVQIKMIDQSITNGWKGIFQLKDSQTKQPKNLPRPYVARTDNKIQ